MKTALYPGSFNPFTVGHADIVARGLALFDRIVIAVGVNAAKSNNGSVEDIAHLYRNEPRVTVAQYSGLTIDTARRFDARFILRGVRSIKDFEYERDMAQINTQLSGIETVILFTRPELAAVSSSVVRELQSLGADISAFIPSDKTL